MVVNAYVIIKSLCLYYSFCLCHIFLFSFYGVIYICLPVASPPRAKGSLHGRLRCHAFVVSTPTSSSRGYTSPAYRSLPFGCGPQKNGAPTRSAADKASKVHLRQKLRGEQFQYSYHYLYSFRFAKLHIIFDTAKRKCFRRGKTAGALPSTGLYSMLFYPSPHPQVWYSRGSRWEYHRHSLFTNHDSQGMLKSFLF